MASAASAHAILLGADPPPNIGLSASPTAVRLRFSEPVRVPPSTVAVLDRNGRNYVSSVRRATDDPQSMVGALRPLARDVYRVQWRSVSALDGHTITGSYFFGVGEPPPGAPAESQSGPLAGAGAPGIAFRIVQDGALLLLLGLSSVELLCRSRLPRATEKAEGLALWTAPVALTAALATVLTESLSAGGWSLGGIASYLSSWPAGWARAALLVFAAAALVAAVARDTLATMVTSALALSAIAIAGHPVTTTRPAAYMAANAVHVVFAGVWLGGTAAIALVWWRAQFQREEILILIRAASPYALASAAIVAITGGLNALGQLGSVSDLWRSGYGIVLLAKTTALVVAASLGARHSFVLRRRLAAASANPGGEREASGMRRAVTAEAWVGLGAVVLATILVAFPNPPAEGARAARQGSTVPAIFAVDNQPFVTLADHDGPLLIGLVIAPPKPGPVTIATQLINATGSSTEGTVVSLAALGPSGQRRAAVLLPCGPGCYRTHTSLDAQGVWSLAITAGSRHVSFRVPLPTPDGTAILHKLRAAWNRLRALQIDETFRSGGELVVQTRYQYQAPDRARITASSASFSRDEIDIGSRSYTKDSKTGRWTAADNPLPLSVPFPFTWERADVQPRLLSDSFVDGHPVYVLAVFDSFGIWYRIAVDKQMMQPLQDQMRAIGHFMDRMYSHFDQSLDIRPPV